MSGRIIAPASIFLSYAHEDKESLFRLEKHLSPLCQEGLAVLWYDAKILPGKEWDREINQNLYKADVIVFLVSADFFASKYCCREREEALKLERERGAIVVPVLLHSVDWTQAPFSHQQVIPRGGVPIEEHSSREKAFTNVAKELRKVVENLLTPAGASPPLSLFSQPAARAKPASQDFLASLREKKEILEETLVIAQRIDPPPPELGGVLHQLGLVHLNLGEFQAARDRLQNSLALAQDDPQFDPQALSSRRSHLAEVLRCLDELDQALELATASVNSSDSGGNSLDLMARLNELALVLISRGEDKSAEEKIREAIAVGTRFGLEKTPDFAVVLHNLAFVLEKLGDYKTAEHHLYTVIAIDEHHHGSEHPEVALDRNSLGLVFQAQGRNWAANKQFRWAHRILVATLGEDHPHTATVRSNL